MSSSAVSSALGVIIPLALVAAHAAFLYSNYTAMIGRADNTVGVSGWNSILLATAYIVCVQLGMRIMHRFEALELKAAMQIYNVYETLLSAVMLYIFVGELWGHNPFTMPVDRGRAGSRMVGVTR